MYKYPCININVNYIFHVNTLKTYNMNLYVYKSMKLIGVNNSKVLVLH